MSLFKWTEALTVGVEEMDHEHKQLIDLMNGLHLACLEQKSKPVVEEALKTLILFSQKHFSDEEALMMSHEYPDLEKHKRAHVDLLKRMDAEQKKFFISEKSALEEGFFSFLRFWIKTHIQGVDVKYGFHANRPK